MDPPHRDRPKRNRSPERAKSPPRRDRDYHYDSNRNDDRYRRDTRDGGNRVAYVDHDRPRHHINDDRGNMEGSGGTKRPFTGPKKEDDGKQHTIDRNSHNTPSAIRGITDSSSGRIISAGVLAKPDEGLFAQDLSMPSYKVLDDETYAKRIEEQLEAIRSAERADEEAEEARKARLSLFAKIAQSSATATPKATPAAVATSKLMSSTSSSISSAKPSSQSQEKVEEKIKPKPFESAFRPIQTASSIALKPVEDDDDMFAESFVDKIEEEQQQQQHKTNGEGEFTSGSNGAGASGPANDDDEGYYSFTVGEMLAQGRYEVLGFYGKGVYSNVIRALDKRAKSSSSSASLNRSSSSSSEHNGHGSSHTADALGSTQHESSCSSSTAPSSSVVAIKLLRNNAHMKRSGKKEVKILRRLNESDPLGKCFCMKLEDSFEEHGHLCLVFEALDMNLTEVIKMYGHHVGLHIKAVRSYAFKLFKALSLLKKCNVIHADIKPDNVLVSKDRNTVKLADFGTAFESQEATLTTQLVSRFYRAPEIVIGMAHSFPLDMFSMGCCLYELATGKYLLPSTDENHHLKLIMELQGPFSKKMLSACHPPFLEQHFTMDGTFLERYADPLDPTRIMVRRVEMPQKATRDLAKELFQSYGPSLTTDVEVAWVNRLADLINRCLTLDPRKRITPEEALSHGFF